MDELGIDPPQRISVGKKLLVWTTRGVGVKYGGSVSPGARPPPYRFASAS